MSDRVDIREVLDQIDTEYLLDREGIQYRVTTGSSGTQINVKECPVCGSGSWKVYLNADTGLGNCFAGSHPPGENFNKWSFASAHLGDPPGHEVLSFLREIAREQGWRSRKVTSVDVNHDVGDLVMPDSVEIPFDGKNLRYLEQRGVDKETAGYFHLRFSKNGVFWYRTSEGEVRYQSYANRVIVPIYDIDSNLVSFQGRDTTGAADKKYLFPPGFASTGKHLFNAQNARRSERVVVGEGAFDVMATKMAFDQDVELRSVEPIGTFGKHLSHGSDDGEDQLNKFLRLKSEGLKEVTFMWDGSIDAIEAALDAALLVSSIGLVTRLAILPLDKDPNEVPANVVRYAYRSAQRVTRPYATKLKIRLKSAGSKRLSLA